MFLLLADAPDDPQYKWNKLYRVLNVNFLASSLDQCFELIEFNAILQKLRSIKQF